MDNKILKNKNGYKYCFDKCGKQVFVHRRVIEKKLGRPIKKGCEVHHINKNKNDNRPNNLVELNKNQHRKLHLSERAGGE